MDDTLRERLLLLANTMPGLSAKLSAAANQEAAVAYARTMVGDEVVEACITWAKTTVLTNSDAFDICWRAGGPGEAVRSLWYEDAVTVFWHNFRYR
jgi:hypothetical protein